MSWRAATSRLDDAVISVLFCVKGVDYTSLAVQEKEESVNEANLAEVKRFRIETF